MLGRAGGPAAETLDDRFSLITPFGQFIDLGRGGGWKLPAGEKSRRFQPLESLRQHVGAYSGQIGAKVGAALRPERSEETTSELNTHMRLSYAVLCLNKKT